MRIISGSHRGRRLKSKNDGRLRPTSDRVREAVFNILPPDLSDARVLDLFAGTGALGIEALSRGAFAAVFVDASRDAAKAIRGNLADFGLADQGRVINKRVATALRQLADEGRKFDLVLADPPYRADEPRRVMEALAELDLLSDEAIVVIEHEPEAKLSAVYGKLNRTDYREYGGSAVSFFEGRPK